MADPPQSSQVWLAVETATPVGSVAVWRDGFALELTLRIQGNHSERLLPAIDYALAATETEPEEVTSFVTGAGPGSFTGVRIAASMAKGWVMARGAALYAYSSLLVVAAGSGARGLVCPMFDARRGEVYGACYDLRGGRVGELMPPTARPIGSLLDELASRELEPVFVGEGAIAYEDQIKDRFPRAQVQQEHVGFPRAASLLWLRRTVPALGLIESPAEWEPEYVRDWRVTGG